MLDKVGFAKEWGIISIEVANRDFLSTLFPDMEVIHIECIDDLVDYDRKVVFVVSLDVKVDLSRFFGRDCILVIISGGPMTGSVHFKESEILNPLLCNLTMFRNRLSRINGYLKVLKDRDTYLSGEAIEAVYKRLYIGARYRDFWILSPLVREELSFLSSNIRDNDCFKLLNFGFNPATIKRWLGSI